MNLSEKRQRDQKRRNIEYKRGRERLQDGWERRDMRRGGRAEEVRGVEEMGWSERRG